MASGFHFDYSGAQVLVTGGSNGIGLAIAKAFADSQAAVTITGTRKSPADYGHDLSRFRYRQLDLRDRAALAALGRCFEHLDVLVNNAGSTRAYEEWKPDVFRDAIDILLMSVFELSIACKPALQKSQLEGGASVVNIASMAAFLASCGSTNPGYAAAKAGVVLLTKNLGSSWAPDHIRVNAVAPGLIETNMTAPMKGVEAMERPVIERTPMGRWGNAEEIADPVLFLASSAARFVTGQTLCVDGGLSLG